MSVFVLKSTESCHKAQAVVPFLEGDIVAGILRYGVSAPVGTATEIFIVFDIFAGADVAQENALACQRILGSGFPVDRLVNLIAHHGSILAAGKVILNDLVDRKVAVGFAVETVVHEHDSERARTEAPVLVAEVVDELLVECGGVRFVVRR